MNIRISWRRGAVTARLKELPAAKQLYEALPHASVASRWGDAIYFSCPLEFPTVAEAAQVVERGAVCYWAEARSIALPFGPGPISIADECRLPAPGAVLGHLQGNPRQLADIAEGEEILVEKA